MSLFRDAALLAQTLANATPAFAAIEQLMLRRPTASIPPPILIVGCPRSGTTLLYEILTTSLRTAYPTNAASLLYRAPVLATVIAKVLCKEHEPKFASDTGYIAGLLAPSEAGALMRHWFTGSHPLAARDPTELDRIVASLTATMEGPLVLKNLYLDRAIDLVFSALPGCVILRLRRNPRFTAQSILGTRQRELGSQDIWWGPRPPGAEAVLQGSPVRQVAWQVAQIENWLDRLSGSDRVRDRLFSCGYEELCARPASVLDRFVAFYRGVTGVTLEARGSSPVCFTASDRVTLPAVQWQELEACLAEYGHSREEAEPA